MKKSNLFKRILAYTLVLSVIFSQIVFSFGTSAAEKTPVWDGTKAENFAGGDGNAASPFLIETAEQLYKMVEEYHTYEASYGKYFKITKDIYLNDVVDGDSIVDLWGKKNWLEAYGDTIAIASKANSFNGTLDGDGHTIYGLYADGSEIDGSSLGLFPAIASYAVVENLNFNNLLITGGSGYGGAIAGQAIYYAWQSAAKITNCSVVNATIGQWQNMEMTGGFIGNITECSVTFTNCYSYDLSLSNWTSSGVPGGIVGSAYKSGTLKINNSYSAGDFPTNSNVSKAVCTNVYTDTAIPEGNTTAGVTVLTSEQMKGDAAKTNMAGFDFEYTWKAVDNSYPVLTHIKVWDGSTDTSFLTKYAGTAEDPYIIENGAQLRGMVDQIVTYSNLTSDTKRPYFKIVNDIYLNPITESDMVSARASAVDGVNDGVAAWDEKGYKKWRADWSQGSGFYGVVDGGGHTVYGVYSNTTYAGLINDTVGDTVIKNINLKNSYLYGKVVGGIVGQPYGANSTLTVIGCSVDNTAIEGAIKTDDYTGSVRVAGIVGGVDKAAQKITVSYCSVTNMTFETYNTTYPGIESAFIGYVGSSGSHDVINCYTDDTVHPVCNVTNKESNFLTIANRVTYTNVYTTYPETFAKDGVVTVTDIKGEAAKTNMPGFDFDLVWKTVDGGYPVLRENPLFAWDGTTAESFAGGTGTENDPFLIENGGQLYKMVAEYSNSDVTVKPETQTYFKLTADINLGGKQWYTHKIWSDNINNTNYTTGFNGIIYGEGHKIFGLTVIGTSSYSSVGLIPVATQGAAIYDLHLENGTLTQTAWNGRAVGGFIGLAVGTEGSAPITIDGCSVNDFEISSENGSAAFVAYSYSQSITISDSYCVDTTISNTATDSSSSSGAFIAVTGGNDVRNSIIIENSHCADVAATILSNDAFKAITTYKNVYTSNEAYDGSVAGLTKLTVAQMTGVNAKENLAGFNFNQIWQYGAEGEYPTHKTSEEKAMYWDGTAAENFAGGDGTIENPYEVSNAKELYLLANSDTASTYGKYFELTNDIEISSTNEGWESENPYSWTKKTAYLDGFTYSNSFAGTLDGNGYTVSGLYYEDAIDNGNYAYGLIPFVTADAVIKNLNVENVAGNVTGEAYVGAVVGAAHVTEQDVANPLKMVLFVGVNVADSNVALLGGATRGVKFELCNAETLIGIENDNISVRNCNGDAKYSDNVVIYNSLNVDSTTLVTIRNNFLGDNDYYITDINGDSAFDARDIVSAKKCLTMVAPDEVLVWSDEFNGDALDYSVWSTNTTMSRGSTLEYADNSTVNDGTLTLSCNDTGKTDANGDKIYSVNYGLDTLNKMSFKYGRLEMRAKVPFGAGAFPSLWLTSRSAIGYDTLSEYSTEIDIFEVFGKTNTNNALVTCIHKWYNDENGNKTGSECSSGTGILDGNTDKVPESDRSYIVNGDAQNDFHTFVFEWDEDSMSFSVDGTVYYTALRSDMDDFDLDGYDTNSDGIFNQAVCLRLNNHMYTTGEGAAYTYTGNADEIDASKLNYEIDYIRLYQKNDGKSEITFK